MVKFTLKISFLFVLLILLSIQGLTNLEQQNQIHPNQRQLKNNELPQNLNLDPDFGKIPLYFIPNKGQVDEKALFYAKASKYTLWLTQEGLVFDSTRRINKDSKESIRQNLRDINNPEDIKYEKDVSSLVFIEANRSPEVIPVDVTEHKVNYFKGKDESKWQSNVQTSGAVLYKELYPCIDLKVYGVEKQIEYDFVVKPGGEVSDIGFEYKDVEKTRIDNESNLIVDTEFGEIKHSKPVCYQVIGGERVKIKAEFMRKEDNTYGFQVKEYNKNYELIIDPVVLVYSTLLGGEGLDSGRSIAVDFTGSIYVAGNTNSMKFPTKNPVQGSYGGGANDAFITKINASGTALVYSTYLGGSGEEGRCCTSIAVDSEGAAYVIGFTISDDFPTKNPIQGSYGGGQDAFITKINASGTALVYSTYLGGSEWDFGFDIEVDLRGAAYVTGGTLSIDFPTKNPIQGINPGTYDAFITKINASGTTLIYSTCLGGSGVDTGFGMAVDSEGAAYVTANTHSTDFPTKNPIQGSYGGGFEDAFITKINSSGKKLIYSTYLGGSDADGTNGIAVDSEGVACVTGWTYSSDFPTKNPIQGSFGGGDFDAFCAKINSSGGVLAYSTYLGGSSYDEGKGIAVDSEGAAYVTGYTNSIDFPTKNPIQGSHGGGESDIFIAKIASERIRIVSWNILNYPDCLVCPGMNEGPREEYFRKALEFLAPDILIVQEMASSYGVNQFLTNVLKPISKKYKAAKFYDGPDTDNAFFYDKSKFKLQSRQQLPTSFRDISEYTLKIKKGPGKSSKLNIYSVHFKEGLSAGDKNQRENEANILRTYLNGLPLNSLFLVCGTFNMTESNEKAFKILTDVQIDDIGRLKDPIAKLGKWHHKKKFKSIHTESTRKAKYGDGASGGLNDRFDMILISYSLDQNGKLTYRPDSCVVYGNDGKHFKKDINKPTNRVISPDFADALYKASDHLPVIIELKPEEKSSQTNKFN